MVWLRRLRHAAYVAVSTFCITVTVISLTYIISQHI